MSCSCNDHSGNTSGRRDYQYAVKVVVGAIPKPDQPGAPLPLGNYFTKVNVHNHSRCDCVTFKWKVAVGNPGLRVGPISGFSEATLCADEALEIVNRDMFNKLKETMGDALPAHFEGWVVIESPEELDVVAVYATSGIGATAQVSAFHTERVQARCMVPCEDLFGDLSTGAAMWELQRPSQTGFTWAVLSQPHPAWTTAPGAVWVTPSGNAPQTSEPNGTYTYRLTFKLCSGFSDAAMQFAMAADDQAQVFLNGQAVNPTSGNPNFASLTNFVIATGFKSGSNELTIVVKNVGGGPTGLLLHGALQAKDGQCPGEGFPQWPCPEITYQVHVKRIFPWATGAEGWLPWVSNGNMAGTVGQHRRVEAYRASLSGTVAPGTSIEYCGHLKNVGWTHAPSGAPGTWAQEGTQCGTTGQDRRMEAIAVRFLVAPPCCSIRYKVHMRKSLFGSSESGGDSNWMHDGAIAGTTGENRRIEAIWMDVDCIR